MELNSALKSTVEDLLNYFNNECFLNIKISDKNVKIGSEDFVQKIDMNSLSLIDQIIDQVNDLRRLNQTQLTLKKFSPVLFANTEIVLSSATEAFKKIKEEFENIKFLQNSNDYNIRINMNDKFVVRKITTCSQRILNKYENMPARLVNSKETKELLEILKKITVSESLKTILELTKEILAKQNVILKPDHSLLYNEFIDEYCWVQDIEKISIANASFMSLIVNVEIYTNFVKERQYIPSPL